MMRTIAFSALAIIASLTGCGSPQGKQVTSQNVIALEGWTAVPPAELSSYFDGTTMSGVTDRGSSWASYFAPDGTMRGTSSRDGTIETDTGTYVVNDDGTWCRTWARWSSGKQGCARVYRKDGRLKHVVTSGRIGGMDAFEADFATGNPRAL